MNLEQIKKDLEEFKCLKTKANGGVDYLHTSVLLIIPIEKHLEELIAEVEEDESSFEEYRKEHESLAKSFQKVCYQLQKAEEVIRFYADYENWRSSRWGQQNIEDTLLKIVCEDAGKKAKEYLNEQN